MPSAKIRAQYLTIDLYQTHLSFRWTRPLRPKVKIARKLIHQTTISSVLINLSVHILQLSIFPNLYLNLLTFCDIPNVSPDKSQILNLCAVNRARKPRYCSTVKEVCSILLRSKYLQRDTSTKKEMFMPQFLYCITFDSYIWINYIQSWKCCYLIQIN